MPFEIPQNIHPSCARLAWLIGTWVGNGHGEYPGIEPFQFGQEVIFQQDGRPFIHYFSRAWITDAEGNTIRPAAQETGFLRPQEDGTLEVVMTHNLGFVEVWLDGAQLTLANGEKRIYGKTIQAARAYLKAGIYRGGSNDGHTIVEHDDIAVATTFDAATGG